MGKLYTFLRLSVGCIQTQMGDEERQQAYGSDITLRHHNEFGFDYLREQHEVRRRQHGAAPACLTRSSTRSTRSSSTRRAPRSSISAPPSSPSALLSGRPHHPEIPARREIRDKYGNKSTNRRLHSRREVAHLPLRGRRPAMAEEASQSCPTKFDPTNIEVTARGRVRGCRAHHPSTLKDRTTSSRTAGDHRGASSPAR